MAHAFRSVADATENGTAKDVLLTVRAVVATAIDNGPAARDLAALVRRLMEIDAEVRALEPQADDPLAGLDN